MLAVSPIDAQAASILAGVRVKTQRASRASPPTVQSVLDWARENATIVLPTEGRRPFVPYDYQARFLEDDARYRIVLKSRQTGISNAIAIEALHKAITRPDSTELFVSKDQKAASVLIRYCQHTLNGLRNPPKLVNENASSLVFPNGSQIVSLPATPSTGRSMAATDVYLDEFAFTQYDQLIYESIIGTISTGGRLTVNSTANGRANMYFRLWSGLEGGDWSRHKIHWSDCPRYRDDPTWEPRTRASMTRQAFAQEYDCDFVASGDAVFDPDDLARCLVGWDPEPSTCDALITAWDIGRRTDHTVGITIGRRAEDRIIKPFDGHGQTVKLDVWHEVEYERFLAPYPLIQARIDDRRRRRGRTYVESNGIGDPVIENLAERVEPFQTTARTKVQAIEALQLLIQQGRFKFGSEQLARELGLYQWDDRALVQDSVMAAAIAAVHAAGPQPRPFRAATGGTRPLVQGYDRMVRR